MEGCHGGYLVYLSVIASKHTDLSVFYTETRYKIRNTEEGIKYTDFNHSEKRVSVLVFYVIYL